MKTDTKLLPCPFCGANAHFEMDDARWEWVECESCGMQSDRGASLMEDCKPMLAAAWNTRAKWGHTAPSGEPVAWAFKYDDGTWHDPSTTEHSSGMRPLFAAPKPVGREPEFDQFLSDVMTAAGLVTHGKQCKQLGERLGAAVMKLRVHGIKKGGQHGAE